MPLTPQRHYDIPARRISGSREEKLEQIDDAIQELLDIKVLECASDRPPVHFFAVPRRSHWIGMTFTIAALLVLLLLLGVRAAHAQAPAQPATDDKPWQQVKFGAALEGYYQYDWNTPADGVIPFRAYDSRSNSFSLQQAALVIDAAPDPARNRRLGLRLDLQFGQATEALQGSAANEPRPDVYRHVWQAFGTYVFPVGRGLQLDFGKFASNLGYETNYAKDDFNFSRALLFNFLPYYHMGLRAALPLSDRLTVMYMLTNGIQQTEDFNDFKSNHFSAVVKPSSRFASTVSYYFGREQAADLDGWFKVFDANGSFAVSRSLTFAFDVTHAGSQRSSGDPWTTLSGAGLYGRQQITRAVAAAVRYERLRDEGLFTAIAQRLQEITTTAEYKFAEGFVARAEWRRDWSDRLTFAATGGRTRYQNTALAGLVWWIGNKDGAW